MCCEHNIVRHTLPKIILSPLHPTTAAVDMSRVNVVLEQGRRREAGMKSRFDQSDPASSLRSWFSIARPDAGGPGAGWFSFSNPAALHTAQFAFYKRKEIDKIAVRFTVLSIGFLPLPMPERAVAAAEPATILSASWLDAIDLRSHIRVPGTRSPCHLGNEDLSNKRSLLNSQDTVFSPQIVLPLHAPRTSDPSPACSQSHA